MSFPLARLIFLNPVVCGLDDIDVFSGFECPDDPAIIESSIHEGAKYSFTLQTTAPWSMECSISQSSDSHSIPTALSSAPYPAQSRFELSLTKQLLVLLRFLWNAEFDYQTAIRN